MRISENIRVKFQHNTLEKKTVTAVEVGNQQFLGVSKVHPNDIYDKAIGRKTSLVRALDKSMLSKADRTLVWDTLRSNRVKI